MTVTKAESRSGITRRLIVLIVLFSSAITLVITALQLFDEYTRGVDSVRAQVRQIERLSLSSLTENLWNLYDRQIQSQLEDLSHSEGVAYLEIRAQGRTVAFAGTVQLGTSTTVDTIPMVYARGGEKFEIGELRIHTTLEGVYRHLYDRLLVILASNAIKTAIVSVFMFFLFQFVVTRHLDRISSYLQEFRLDRADKKLRLTRSPVGDEIDLVVDKINQLMGNLSETTISRDRLEAIVEERTRELQEAQDELLRKGRLAMLGQVTATVSHELRNPLGVIRSSLYTLRKRLAADETAAEACARIDRNVERCDRIIDELLDYTRITRLEKQATRLDAWLREVIDEIEIPSAINLVRDFRLDDLELEIDPDRLRRAIINVVDNAWQAIESDQTIDQGRIVIQTREENGRILVVVRDNGPGMPQEVLDKAFVALYSTRGFGVGLGMPTVKQIMQQHGGGIEIDSEPGRGAMVRLWLPAGQQDTVADSDVEAAG